MAAYGLVEDQIALRLNGMDKNRLRRKYIDSIKEGRAIASAAGAEAEAAEAFHTLAISPPLSPILALR
jgi:hypothetical protein